MIVTVASSANQRLKEYMVGEATETCVYPGIAQCFAIAGWTPGGMLCTHLSPGATAEDMSDTFASLRGMGGDAATVWYVVGPFTPHFAVGKAQWHSVKDMQKTFRKELKNSSAVHWVLDATAERNTQRMYPGISEPMTFSSIDVRAEHRHWQGQIWFSYKETSSKVTDWNRFDSTKFVRF